MQPRRTSHWSPQPGPQKALVDCPLTEVFFGGARGGGKTDGVLGKWAIKERRYGRAFNAIMFRKTTVSSEDAIERSKQIYQPLGGKFNETKSVWRMPNGGRVTFAYLDKVQDAEQYQGRNVSDAWVEEAGQYPAPDVIDRLYGVLRSASGIPVQLVLTANPGGAGQQWIRDRYQLAPFPKTPKIVNRHLADGSVHQMAVIPSRITDNLVLLESDPAYISRLQMVGGAALVKAWLEGDWTAVEGAFFSEWSEAKHVLRPVELPRHWMRFRSMDWGSAKPFSVGWWAVCSDEWQHPDGPIIPRGSMVRYREWYGASGPNKGLKLTAEAVARGIRDREGAETISFGVLDPAAFAEDGGPSLADRMAAERVFFDRADNARVAQRGAMGGWDQLRARLIGDGVRPALYVFSTCVDLIRTLPVAQHDANRAEDLDTNSEDHALDEARYACMSRPYTPPPVERPTDRYQRPRHSSADSAGSWQAA